MNLSSLKEINDFITNFINQIRNCTSESVSKANTTCNSADIISTIVFIIILIFLNYKYIMPIFNKIRNRHEEFIKNLLKNDYIDENNKNFLKNELNKLFFKKLTGLSANDTEREKIYDIFHRKLSQFSFKQIKGASEYLKLELKENQIIFKFKWTAYLLFIFFCILLVIFSIYAVAIIFNFNNISGFKAVLLHLVSLGFFLLASNLFMHTILCIRNAYIIKKLLKNENKLKNPSALQKKSLKEMFRSKLFKKNKS